MTYRRDRLVLALAGVLLALLGGVDTAGWAQEEPTVVGKIGDYSITAAELEQRMMRESRPYDPTNLNEVSEAPTAKAVLEKMLRIWCRICC